MSKEIYKEYVNKWIDEEDRLKKCEINDLYLFCGHPIRVNAKEDLLVIAYDFERVTRKPKTQMINGHEVVAPRYYEPKVGDTVYTHNPWHRDGVNETEVANYHKISNIAKGGWFDNKEDALAYANAHRENKND